MATQYVYMVRINATGEWLNNANEWGDMADTPAIFLDASDAMAYVGAWTEFSDVTVVAAPVGGWTAE